MGNAVHQVRAQVLDMLATTARLLKALAGPVQTPALSEAYVRSRVAATLETHAQDLRERLALLGAGTSSRELTGAFEHRPAAACSMGDVFSHLSLLRAADLMLETSARALGFSSTAALAARHRDEVEALLIRIRELLPQAA